MTRRTRGKLRALGVEAMIGSLILSVVLFYRIGWPIRFDERKDFVNGGFVSELKVEAVGVVLLGFCVLAFSVGLVMLVLPTRQPN